MTGSISRSHPLLQEINWLTQLHGNVSVDPARGLHNFHSKFPAAVAMQEEMFRSVTGAGAYSKYLGKQGLGSGTSSIKSGQLPKIMESNHPGWSFSSL